MIDAIIPKIKAIWSGKTRQLVVTWKNGAESVVDVSRHLADYAVLTPLLDGEAFVRQD